MMMRTPINRSSGFSLIEALVALVVMGFGMLGVVGIQSALRQYSDISKQRSEAVRLAQDRIEDWRAFEQLAAGAGPDYADMVSDGGYVDVATTNTTYQLRRTVTPLPSTAQMPQRGVWLRFDMRWKDRTDAFQEFTFHTHVSGVAPELAGTLLAAPAGGPTRRPLGRHSAIPRSAVDNGDGTSTFSPPGLSGTTWVFGNLSGEITRICNPVCADFLGFLLTGFVRFTSPLTVSPPDPPPGGVFKQPVAADAEVPLAAPFAAIGVQVAQTVPSAGVVSCATETAALQVAYYCAVPVTLAVRRWSGTSLVTGLTISADASDASSAKARVCRYTPQTADPAVPALTPAEHPQVYSNVGVSLANQNFLVIRGGDGTTAFTCPADDPGAVVNGNTFRHQPAT